jgi:hypothetical protein
LTTTLFRRFPGALALLLCAPLLAQQQPVQLLLPSRTLEPRSTFEVRFASDMVAAEQIGKPVDPSPLVLEPAVPGRFIWLSKRSGSFAPEGILPLGTKFRISLRTGLTDAAGKTVRSTLRETAETPPFRIKGESAVSYIDSSNATVLPRHLILFNSDVNAAAAAKFCRYVNGAGARVAAQVEQAADQTESDRLFPVYASDDRSLAVWGETVEPLSDSAGDESEQQAAPEPASTPQPRGNVLHIAPAKPLPPARTGDSSSMRACRLPTARSRWPPRSWCRSAPCRRSEPAR